MTTVSTSMQAHPIYGRKPPGFDLNRQQISMLNVWHRKATEATSQYCLTHKTVDGDPEYAVLADAQRQTFEAAFRVSITSMRDVKTLMEIVDRHVSDNQSADVLTPHQVSIIAAYCAKAAEPVPAKKQPGPLVDGDNLTEAGLLFRYQSYLAEELETVGWVLYGEPRYAFQFLYGDREVYKQLRTHRPGTDYPFFDEDRLPDRARGVLGHLNVDTTKAGEWK